LRKEHIMPGLTMQTKAVTHVIGGGLAGLAAALELAQSGHPVSLHEQHQNPGGNAASRETEGFIFNLGPHALYRDGAACRILRSWGIDPTGGVPQLDGVAAMVTSGRSYPFVGGISSLIRCRFLSIRERIDAGRATSRLMSGELPPPERTMAQWLD